MWKKAAFGAGALFVLVAAAPADATLLVADFNDIAAGTINGKFGGTGLTGSWSGSAGGNIVAGDLTSSLYNVPQSGTAQRFQNNNATGLRQNYRSPTASPTGTVWFSFLARADSAGDRAGLSINVPTTATPFDNVGNVYAYLVGSTLNFSFGAGTAGTASGYTVGNTHLIIGQMIITGSGGADTVRLWANPDLVANPDINAYTPVYTNSTVNALDAITVLGAIGSRADGASTAGGGNVDNIRFSDGNGVPSVAFADVTGVPEPTVAAVVSLVAAAGLLRRSRRSRA